MNLPVLVVVVLVYCGIVAWLGWLGYRHTRSASDYLVGGRQIHPMLMALAYGSTFISTSAIVGFGGMAGLFGMGLLWLTAANIFFGIFVAFVVFGRPTRRLGAALDAHTFPELLGRRFQSKFIQGFAGVTVAVLMPLYAAAVLIGGASFLKVQLHMDYNLALLIFAVITMTYVLFGGLKGVIYTDAFQAGVMFVGMAILLVAIYLKTGGLGAHAALTSLADQVPAALQKTGHRGWTAMPAFGSPTFNTLVTTIVMGVGIGVLAQPQLTLRFMTVKSGRELNRALIPGGIFILFMTGVAFVVGALSNVYFWNTQGKTAMAVAGKVEEVIPAFIKSAMPAWFGYVFMLALLAAAMSTLSAQFHVIGTAIGRDVYQEVIAGGKQQQRTIPIAKVGVVVGFVATGFLSWKLGPDSGIVAIATSLFFGMCASAFLPLFAAALFWKRATKAGAIAGMLGGTFTWALWVLLVHQKESAALGVSQLLFDRPSVLAGSIWTTIDPIVIALPISTIVTIVASLVTQPVVGRAAAPAAGTVPSP